MARQLARRQRRERLAGIGLAALGVVVLVVALIALRQPSKNSTLAGSATMTPTKTPAKTLTGTSSATKTASGTPSSTPPRSSSSAAATSSTPPSADRLPLVVLNNTTITGLAAQASDRFRAGGWTVTSFGNYQNDILSTCAYYDPAVPDADRDAKRLQAQFPTIKRVAPKFAELPAGPIVVVLTPDYS